MERGGIFKCLLSENMHKENIKGAGEVGGGGGGDFYHLGGLFRCVCISMIGHVSHSLTQSFR
jgi:hypothetical protein